MTPNPKNGSNKEGPQALCTARRKIIIDQFGTTRSVVCRKCETCRAARKRRWIGRLLAEELRADHVLFTTWTYGGGYDNP